MNAGHQDHVRPDLLSNCPYATSGHITVSCGFLLHDSLSFRSENRSQEVLEQCQRLLWRSLMFAMQLKILDSNSIFFISKSELPCPDWRELHSARSKLSWQRPSPYGTPSRL